MATFQTRVMADGTEKVRAIIRLRVGENNFSKSKVCTSKEEALEWANNLEQLVDSVATWDELVLLGITGSNPRRKEVRPRAKRSQPDPMEVAPSERKNVKLYEWAINSLATGVSKDQLNNFLEMLDDFVEVVTPSVQLREVRNATKALRESKIL